MSRIAFEIIEADSGAQDVVDGKLIVSCDCKYTDRCLQGKPIGSERCSIRIDAKRLKKKERKRLKECQR